MLHSIECITADEQGYIYWKKQQIEHFNSPCDVSMYKQTLELARRCRILEKRGTEINTNTVVWKWDESGNGDRWEIAFDGHDSSELAQRISKRICQAYGINGLCDPGYIASVIDAEMKGN